MSPALNGSSALECFERSNMNKICNGIMFDFYPGLPHMCMCTKLENGVLRNKQQPQSVVNDVFDQGEFEAVKALSDCRVLCCA